MSGTHLEEIYDSFLENISDYTFVPDTSEDVEDIHRILLGYFKKARAKFYKCRNSLELIKDEDIFGSPVYHTVKNGETLYSIADKYSLSVDELAELNDLDVLDEVVKGAKLFVGNDYVTLTDFEIMTITHLMTVEYMRQQVLSSEVVKQSLSDKDFKIYSQANQLRELNLLYRLMQRESNKMMTEYSYMGMTDDGKK